MLPSFLRLNFPLWTPSFSVSPCPRQHRAKWGLQSVCNSFFLLLHHGSSPQAAVLQQKPVLAWLLSMDCSSFRKICTCSGMWSSVVCRENTCSSTWSNSSLSFFSDFGAQRTASPSSSLLSAMQHFALSYKHLHRGAPSVTDVLSCVPWWVRCRAAWIQLCPAQGHPHLGTWTQYRGTN